VTLEEIWDRILEYIANHNTTENIFDYNAENNSEQNLNNSPAAKQPQPQPNPDPSPPVSPLTLREPAIPTNPEK
jgi:hypothetical protein